MAEVLYDPDHMVPLHFGELTYLGWDRDRVRFQSNWAIIKEEELYSFWQQSYLEICQNKLPDILSDCIY